MERSLGIDIIKKVIHIQIIKVGYYIIYILYQIIICWGVLGHVVRCLSQKSIYYLAGNYEEEESHSLLHLQIHVTTVTIYLSIIIS